MSLLNNLRRIWKSILEFYKLLTSVHILIRLLLFLPTLISDVLILANFIVEFFPLWLVYPILYLGILLSFTSILIMVVWYLKNWVNKHHETWIWENILERFSFHLNEFGKFMQNGVKSFVIRSIYTNIPTSVEESKHFCQVFDGLEREFGNLKNSFKNFLETKEKDKFSTIVESLNQIIENHSGLVKDFVKKVREAKIEIVSDTKSRKSYEWYNVYYEVFREEYNHFLMEYCSFLSTTANIHKSSIPSHILRQKLFAPQLFYVYARFKDET